MRGNSENQMKGSEFRCLVGKLDTLRLDGIFCQCFPPGCSTRFFSLPDSLRQIKLCPCHQIIFDHSLRTISSLRSLLLLEYCLLFLLSFSTSSFNSVLLFAFLFFSTFSSDFLTGIFLLPRSTANSYLFNKVSR